MFYASDLLLIPDFFELLYVWIRINVRSLQREEIENAKLYFKDQIRFDVVKLNDYMPKRLSKIAEAFVTFNTIHFNKTISVHVFIHEMVHVWQYQRFGSVYIFRSLRAQRSREGYDYGGHESLYHKMLDNTTFLSFNFEQQGQLFEDYCKAIEEGGLNPILAASYDYFINQIRDAENTLRLGND